jgi:hypothetical protein
VNDLTIRTALANRLATIGGLHAYPRPVTQIDLPAAICEYPERIGYDETFGGDRGFALIPVTLIVSHLDTVAGETALAALLDDAAAGSISKAIDGQSSLGIPGLQARATEVRNYGPQTINGDQAALVAQVLIEVMA